MPIDARVDAWATLALKALPYRALFDLLRALGDPVAVLHASRAQLQSIVPKAAVDRLLNPIVAERYAATRAWLDAPEHELIAWDDADYPRALRSEEHTSELQSPCNLVCRLLLEKKKK